MPGKGLSRARSSPSRRSAPMAEVASEEDADRGGGEGADPLDLRVRRHDRARGDGAASRHRRASRTTRRSATCRRWCCEHGYSRIPVYREEHRRRRRRRLREGRAEGAAPGQARRAAATRSSARRTSCRRRRRSPSCCARCSSEQVPHGARDRRVRLGRRAWSRSRTCWRSWSARSPTSTTARSPRSWSVGDGIVPRRRARPPIDDVNELLDVELPDEEWDTVGRPGARPLRRDPEAGRRASSSRGCGSAPTRCRAGGSPTS